MHKNKYLKYYNKNIKQTGGNTILENAHKYHTAYLNFLSSGVPLDIIEEFEDFFIQARIMKDTIVNFKTFARMRQFKCKNFQKKSQFFNVVVNIVNSNPTLFDLDRMIFYNENIYNFYLNSTKLLFISVLNNCVKYKYYDLNSSNHIDHTHNSYNFTQNKKFMESIENIEDIEDREKMEEIKRQIETSPNFANIQKNIMNIFDDYDSIFKPEFIGALLKDVVSDIKCNRVLNCFSSENFNLSNLYTYDFISLNTPDQTVNQLYDKIKYIYLPIAIYTYDSPILYEMNQMLVNMYDPITNNTEYFTNKYVKLSFIILYCLLIIRNKFLNNYNCTEAINTTFGKLPYKPESSYCYRGIFIDKQSFDIDKLSYQVKINSFSREPNGVKEVLGFYYDKKFSTFPEDKRDQIIDNQILVLYIAKNDNNFTPINFFNPQLDVAENEKETVTLPFVKYNCRLIYDYDKTTKIVSINISADLNIDLEAIHKEFFMEINDREFDFQVYYIDSIENLVNF